MFTKVTPVHSLQMATAYPVIIFILLTIRSFINAMIVRFGRNQAAKKVYETEIKQAREQLVGRVRAPSDLSSSMRLAIERSIQRLLNEEVWPFVESCFDDLEDSDVSSSGSCSNGQTSSSRNVLIDPARGPEPLAESNSDRLPTPEPSIKRVAERTFDRLPTPEPRIKRVAERTFNRLPTPEPRIKRVAERTFDRLPTPEPRIKCFAERDFDRLPTPEPRIKPLAERNFDRLPTPEPRIKRLAEPSNSRLQTPKNSGPSSKSTPRRHQRQDRRPSLNPVKKLRASISADELKDIASFLNADEGSLGGHCRMTSEMGSMPISKAYLVATR